MKDNMDHTELTLDECIAILSGRRGLHAAVPWLYRLADYPTRGIRRLGIAPLRFTDGPRGVNLGRSTCFPVTIARGASWDSDMEELIGVAIAKEASAQGANALGSTCINLIRHPGWGRSQESYGADTVLLSRMGTALVRGIQSQRVLAVVKHFACNSIENSRFIVSVEIDERALHEVYLPHFRACADAGAASFMAAYNRINGQYCGQNHMLLTEILREQWKFEGFVMSDFLLGIHGTSQALNAGLDVEMPQTFWFSRRRIRKEINSGRLHESRVREAAGRVIRQLKRFGYIGKPFARPARTIVACPDHQQLSLESARRSIVLLKNRDNTLPLQHISSIALIGPFARKHPLGSDGSASVRPPTITSLLDGLRKVFPQTVIHCHNGGNVRTAADLASSCDVAIVTAGLRGRDEGEYFPLLKGGDRTRCELSEHHIELISAVAASSHCSVVILFGGSAFACGDWTNSVDSILMAWYPGMHGGQALAEIIAGQVNPSGRLPLSFPRRTADLPSFDPRARRIIYDLFHDYRWFDRQEITPAFPFGFGLSYTSFSYNTVKTDLLDISTKNPSILITAEIENIGTCNGIEVAQLYVTRPYSLGAEHPTRELKDFKRLMITVGGKVRVEFKLDAHALRWFDPRRGCWVCDPGTYTVRIGPNALDQPLETNFILME